MRILVCISQVPDTSTKIVLKNNNTSVNSDGVTYVINPYDEWYALIRAIELKESGIATEIHLVTVGKADVEPVIAGINDQCIFHLSRRLKCGQDFAHFAVDT